ncbi:MAG: HNH endonuclease [Flavobacterium sp.]|nr:MAG: HNH endonuclease [Flavobacterium sp.]
MPRFVYPFIIKGYKFFGDDNRKLNRLYHILEIVAFRYKLVSSRADFLSRINEILLGFDGDLVNLREHFRNKFNETWYWGDEKVKEILDGYMYQNPTIHYVLWKYENSIQNKGYKVEGVEIDTVNIEHVSPQVPPDNKKIAHGYETDSKNMYDEEFVNEYVNCLGNLMLISESHNKSIGNRAFREKFNSYNQNPLFNQQAEIKRFVLNNEEPIWNKMAIDDRHSAIVSNFALRKWSFDNVSVE